MKQLIIAVTSADIRDGLVNNCEECPIALSLKRRYPGAYVSVSGEGIEIRHRGRTRQIELTGEIERFMNSFDDFQRMRPTAFFVDAKA